MAELLKNYKKFCFYAHAEKVVCQRNENSFQGTANNKKIRHYPSKHSALYVAILVLS